MLRKRRSGRIAKELQIVLLGTDTAGKVFSEPTKTVVLSRHGAGVISRYRFTPDEVLTLRLPDTTKEAEVRLVGQIGGEPGRYVYGVAFVDPDLHFWPMEFPPPEPFEAANSVTLECGHCQARQNVEQSEIEEDVQSVNGFILRFCATCGISTEWKKSEGGGAPSAAEETPAPIFAGANRNHAGSSNGATARTNFRASSPISSPASSSSQFAGIAAQEHEGFTGALGAADRPAFAEPRTAASGDSPSPYSGVSAISEFASLADIQASPTVTTTTAVFPSAEFAPAPGSSVAGRPATQPGFAPPREVDAQGRPKNRRRHVRIRVNFSACIRHPKHADEIVECENVSKGGVCFHSARQYPLGSTIEIAAPYAPGEAALFVSAKIKRVEPLVGDAQVFRYGVEYANSSSPSLR